MSLPFCFVYQSARFSRAFDAFLLFWHFMNDTIILRFIQLGGRENCAANLELITYYLYIIKSLIPIILQI
jgi:hypothetical protein